MAKKHTTKRATKAKPLRTIKYRAPKKNHKNPVGPTHGTVAHMRKLDHEIALLKSRVGVWSQHAVELGERLEALERRTANQVNDSGQIA